MPYLQDETAQDETALVLDPAYLPKKALYGAEDSNTVGWELSPQPYFLSKEQHQQLSQIGQLLHRWLPTCESLYRDSLEDKAPNWVSALIDQGKPEHLKQFSMMKRWKSQSPLVIRPDLLVTETGFALCEIDAVPGGIGFTAALNQAYQASGFSVLQNKTIPDDFLEMLKAFYRREAPEAQTGKDPVIALIISDEAADYRHEMQWLVNTIQQNYPAIFLVHPKQLRLVRDKLVFEEDGSEIPIDMIYRFFELFDLANIPGMDLLQYALKKRWVVCTPPFKPVYEEKAWLSLIHHPALQGEWLKRISQQDLDALRALIPEGWILDPRPLPPQAVIPGLTIQNHALQDFRALKKATQKERHLVIKPSGFSPLAWGSKGVTIGHDESQEAWAETVEMALASYGKTPYLLQRFEKPKTESLLKIDAEAGEQNFIPFSAKTRLCPYYFVTESPTLVGVLATACPADKKIIHGMKDAILAPVTTDTH